MMANDYTSERPWWQKAIYQFWPRIYRIINQTLFFIIMVIKNAVKIAMQQVKHDY
jgi:hypothetical protein